MSDHWLIFIPTDPVAKPSKERMEAACEVAHALCPNAHEIRMCLTDTPVFHSCGENLENVFCPYCAAAVTEWWGYTAMHEWGERDHADLSVTMPCCGREASLNDLDYQWPQGFACASIELLHPKVIPEAEDVTRIEAALGMPVRVIWMHL